MLFGGGLVPSYIMWTQIFHIKNTLWAYIFPSYLLSPFFVIMMRTYFTSNIPISVIESARIEGASEIRILRKVVLPMSLPILATIGLFVGLGYWNDWTNGLYYINDDRQFSIQVLLNRMLMDVQFLQSSAAIGVTSKLVANLPSTAIKMAVATLGILPILLAYPFFQRYFVKGITIGAVKG
jgi:putative aldouronate transport system permease protein